MGGTFCDPNSLRAGLGKSTLSTTNTDVYATAQSSVYGSNYHDITSGANGTCGSLCSAAAGYDYVTGLGSPQANNLITGLVNRP